MLLKVLDHAVWQRGVNLPGTIIAAHSRQVHNFAAFRGARARRRLLRWAEDGVGAGGYEVGFHEGLEIGVWVAVAEDCDTGVEPGRRTGLKGVD